MTTLTLQSISAEVINDNFDAIEAAVNSKADLNGDSTQKFHVADAVTSTEAINKGQLDSTVSQLSASSADISLDNINSTAKSMIANLAMPSNSRISLSYTNLWNTIAPANGYVSITATATCGGQQTCAANSSVKLAVNSTSYAAGNYLYSSIPVMKGQSYLLWTNATVNTCTFTYAQGEI